MISSNNPQLEEQLTSKWLFSQLPRHPYADGKSGEGSLPTKHYSCEGNVGDLFLKCEKKDKKWIHVDNVMSSSLTVLM